MNDLVGWLAFFGELIRSDYAAVRPAHALGPKVGFEK